MKALILAGGLGTRLRPLTDEIPKPMVPVAGKPLLEHIVEHLASYDIREICVNLHHLPEKITDYFGDGSRWGVALHYKFEPSILGTAGAIKNFEDILNEDFFVFYGDMLHRLKLDRFAEFHKKKHGIGSVLVNRAGDPAKVDLAELDSDQKLLHIIPKPHDVEMHAPSQYNMWATYVFSKEICNFIPRGRYSELDHEIIPEALRRGESLYGYITDEPIYDIGTWESYQKAEEYYANLVRGE